MMVGRDFELQTLTRVSERQPSRRVIDFPPLGQSAPIISPDGLRLDDGEHHAITERGGICVLRRVNPLDYPLVRRLPVEHAGSWRNCVAS